MNKKVVYTSVFGNYDDVVEPKLPGGWDWKCFSEQNSLPIYEDNMRPEDYLIQAKSWVKNGSQIIGGCCGIGPDLIKSLSNLKL